MNFVGCQLSKTPILTQKHYFIDFVYITVYTPCQMKKSKPVKKVESKRKDREPLFIHMQRKIFDDFDTLRIESGLSKTSYIEKLVLDKVAEKTNDSSKVMAILRTGAVIPHHQWEHLLDKGITECVNQSEFIEGYGFRLKGWILKGIKNKEK